MKLVHQPKPPDESVIGISIEWTTAPGKTVMRNGTSYMDEHSAWLSLPLKIPDNRSDKTRIVIAK